MTIKNGFNKQITHIVPFLKKPHSVSCSTHRAKCSRSLHRHESCSYN